MSLRLVAARGGGFILFLAIGALVVGAIRGQSPRLGPDELHISVRSYQLALPTVVASVIDVPLEVVVRGSDGMPIGSLDRSNFRVLDNGQPRFLDDFSVERRVTSPTPNKAGTVPVTTGHAAPSAAAFTPPSSPTRNIGLYFDDVNTSAKELDQARIAAQRFVSQLSASANRFALMTTSGAPSLAFSADRQALLRALTSIHAHPRYAAHSGGCLRITDYQAYLIVNHLDPSALATAIGNKAACDKQIGLLSADVEGQGVQKLAGDSASEVVFATADTIWNNHRAVADDTLHSLSAAVSDLARQPGPRVLVLASSGFLAGTLENLQDEVIQQALRNQVTINSLDARGNYTTDPTLPLNETAYLSAAAMQQMFTFNLESSLNEGLEREAPLANLALSTGGVIFHNNNDLTLGFRRLGLAPNIAYELAFSPGDAVHDGKFHRIEVEVKPDHHYTVQARRGYFAPVLDTTAASWSATDTAMRSQSPAQELPVEVATRGAAGSLQIHFHLALAQPPFRRGQGRERDNLLFTVGLFNEQGAYVTGKQAEMQLAVKDANWRSLAVSGLSASLSLTAPPGAYRLRCVVEEGNQSELYASTQSVAVAATVR